MAEEGSSDRLDQEEGEAGLKKDRRRKWEAKQAAAGLTRCIVRCHVDDVAKIKAYAAKLLRSRQGTA